MKLNIKNIVLLAAGLLLAAEAFAQSPADRHDVRAGNRRFRKERFQESDIWYRKALVKDSTSVAANYNLANTMYKLQNWDEATKYYDKISRTATASGHGADYWYNVGNAAVQKKDWNKAVDAYAKSLLINPEDLDAKENYAYARLMQKNNQNGGGGGDQNNQDQNKDQNKQDQNKDQNNQDQNNQNNQNNQDQNKQDQNQDQQNQNNGQDQQNQDQNQQQGAQPKISPQQAQQMLQAIQAKEKETQDKVNKEKAAVLKSRQKDKNW